MSAARQITTAPLDELERVISDGLRTFVDVGGALARIRDAGLYKMAGYATFDAYCLDRWEMGRDYAHKLMRAAAVVENVDNCLHLDPDSPPIPSPSNESHARELSRLPTEKQAAAWALAVETAPEGRITARHVASMVDAILRPPPEPANDEPQPSAPEPDQEPASSSAPQWACPRCDARYPVGAYPPNAKICAACARPEPKPRSAPPPVEDEPGEVPVVVTESVSVAALEALSSQRQADPEYQAHRQMQRAVAASLPQSKAQRMVDFVLDGGELALLRLGLDWSVTADSLRAAYRSASFKAHPDRGGSPDEFRRVGASRDLVSRMLGDA